ncbi:universal stress protein (plasmid) [Halococcus dombrowskii]|uniref:Universal stress protein n=1 Tax=Halococcus dombrowskii TaxID=179637 RepID=A0AAV3SMH9_HALDO|nr:universal stress protein [Halococcus dombrowskii]UOO96928.1 universal stress protein [Halococcus dombrowskii]UOO97574.1 universal stress protein [Halococcus dombrowskii]
MYETILVPTDGSKHAIRAAEHAHYLMQAFDATVHLVSAADIQTAGGMFNAGGVDRQFVERIEAEYEDAIATTEETFEGDAIETSVLRGKPADAILEYATEHDIDLVSMGTHGRTGVSRYVAGSVTERVVRQASCPVLTAKAIERSELSGDYEDVLIPTDGSEAASMAIDHGIEIARRAGARVHAVNIVDAGSVTLTPGYSAPPELAERFEAEGERATEEIATRAADVDLDATTSVYEGLPARDLLDYADENGIDLITMGTTGRTGLNRYLLGSTAERVIRHADMPVLAVNARKDVRQ